MNKSYGAFDDFIKAKLGHNRMSQMPKACRMARKSCSRKARVL